MSHGDDGNVPVLTFGDATEEDADGSGVESGMLRGLHEKPAGVAGTLFGDGSVIALIAGLACRGNQSEIGCGFVGGLEAGDIAKGGEDRFRCGEVDAGDSHE